MTTRHDYAKALDELETLHNNHAITEGQYLTHRNNLLTEAHHAHTPTWVRWATLASIIVAALIILNALH